MSEKLLGEDESGAEVRPIARRDLDCWPLGRSEVGSWCVGSAEIDRYIHVPGTFRFAALRIAELLDGTRTLDEVSTEVERDFPQASRRLVRRVYELLSSSNLIVEPRPTYVYQSEARLLIIDVVSLPLTKLTRVVASVFSTYVWRLLSGLSLIFILAAVYGVVFNPGVLSEETMLVGDSYALGLLVSVAFSSFIAILHEGGHYLAAVRYNLRPHALRFGLYAGVFPMMYLDIRGLYTIPLRQRLIVWTAGVWANLAGAAVLIVLITNVSMPLLMHQLLWKLVIANLVFIPLNLSPFLPTDGYFILSNLLGKFELRTQIFQYLSGIIRRRRSTVPSIGLFAWIYMVIGISMLLISTSFSVWWIWKIGLEIEAKLLGPATWLLFATLVVAVVLLRARGLRRAIRLLARK